MFYLFFPSFALENDTFVVWEMFPGNNEALSESEEEEEDFYFSDNDWSKPEMKCHVVHFIFKSEILQMSQN